MRHIRSLLPTTLELAGFASVTFGAFQLAVWLGWVVAGAALLATGYVLDRSTPADPERPS